MATLLGKLEPFDADQEEWPQYVERLEQFFVANDIVGDGKAEKRRATFLSVIGPAPYKLLRSLLSPVKPTEKTFEQLVAVLTEHYNPQPSEVMQRFRFNSRSRKAGETVAAYVADLRRLAEYCNYGTTLDKMLRDRLVWGINDDKTQAKFLQEKDLDFERALTIARGFETADKNLKEMKAPTAEPAKVKEEPVHKVFGKKRTAATAPTATGESGVICHRCGIAGHKATTCRFRDRVCHKCKKKGHLARVCRSASAKSAPSKKNASQAGSQPVRQVDEESDSSSDDFAYAVGTVRQGHSGRVPPIKVQIMIDDCSVPMEIDTGAAVSLMAEAMYHKLWPGRGLSASNIRLQTYSKEPIKVVGTVDVQVSYENQSAVLPLVVVKGEGPTLFGRNWLEKIKLNWHSIHYTLTPGLQEVLSKYADVFKEGLGTFSNYEAKIEVEADATPKFCKARTVPYAMHQKVGEEIDRLVSEGTLEPVDHSDWAAPVVAVLKSDKKSVRLCGDFRMTVNPVSKLNRYPIPKVEDLFATLEGGATFTKLDLSQAYLQLKLDPESRKYVVINTHKGLFRYTRLPYGISSAPGIFQKVMESLLQGIPQVAVYIDDILITGASESEHLQSLEEVLRRLERAGLRAKKSKCKFMVPSVTYLGYVIDTEGLRPLPEKVEAIRQAPTPRNVAELKSYLGLLTYYGKFLPNLATHLAPLYKLLGKNVPWSWSLAQDRAFNKSKELLTSSQLLIHFNPQLPLMLACDASAYGIGAVLAHKLPDGSEKPIGYASRTLNAAERNYSQLEKEGLSCVFGVKRFYSYLFGHHFTLVTDHKPLLGLLGEHKPTSPQASARVRRWSLYLSMFEYTLAFRNTTAHANADALSRLPLPVEPAIVKQPPELVLLADHLANSPVTADQIRLATRKDPQLSPIVQFVQQGWPSSSAEHSSFFDKRHELSLYEGCLLWGSRVVVPTVCREAVLTELHEGHPGISRMKSLARMYVWWPGISNDIASTVRHCLECQQQQPTPAVAPLHPWSWPTRPWARLHLDYAGPFQGKMILVLIDAHSKWIEAVSTPQATSQAVMEELRPLFAKFGIPETIVTDNGTCFVSAEFESFLAFNGIKHLTSAPYHPASNGLAERAVQIVKKGLKKITQGSIRTRLAQVLFMYRLAPQTTTGVSPAEMLLGRRPRSRLDLVKPHTAERVEKNQSKQKSQHDQKAKERKLEVGEDVFVRNYRPSGEKWLPGVIQEETGPVSFRVKLSDGQQRRCHLDQVRKRSVTVPQDSVVEPDVTISLPELSTATGDATPEQTESSTSESNSQPPDPSTESNATRKSYPKRDRTPVVRFEPTWNT